MSAPPASEPLALPPPLGARPGGDRVAVLEDEALVADLRKRKSGLRAAIRAGVTVVLFSSFLACFTGLMLSEPYKQYGEYEDHVRQRFDLGAALPLKHVNSIASFWDFMQRTMMPGIYGNETDMFAFLDEGIFPKLQPLDSFNRLLGAMRLRTVRVVANQDCGVSDTFKRFYVKCYGPYTLETEDTSNYGSNVAPFKYSTDENDRPTTGELAEYPPGGFFEVLTTNKTRSEELIVKLQAEKEQWVDEATRAIFLDFTVWNGNHGLYAVCRIGFEVAPTGNWINHFEIQVLAQRYISPFGFGTSKEWAMMVGEMVICLFVLYYIAEEVSEFSILKLQYLCDGWNALDWTNLVLLIVVLVIRLMTYMEAGGLEIGVKELSDPYHFTNLQGVANNIRTVRQINAFNAVLIWLKTIKYINFIPYVTTLIWTIRMSWQMLVSFISIFLTTFTGFVIAYNVGFGNSFGFLSNFWKCLIFLSRSFLNDVDMTVVYDSSPMLGSMLIVLFVLGVKFVILNLFYAILINAFADAKAKFDEGGKMEEWDKFMEKANMIKNAVWKALDVDQRIKSNFGGLYARMYRKRKFREQKEKLREQRYQAKEQAKKAVLSSVAVQDADQPPAGRRLKRKADSGDGDSSESEVDLGPLNDGYVKRQLRALEGGKGDGQHSEIIMKGVQHMAAGLADRTNWLRGLVLEEMRETRLILCGVSDVLEVLNRRAKDLEAQQVQFLEAHGG